MKNHFLDFLFFTGLLVGILLPVLVYCYLVYRGMTMEAWHLPVVLIGYCYWIILLFKVLNFLLRR